MPGTFGCEGAHELGSWPMSGIVAGELLECVDSDAGPLQPLLEEIGFVIVLVVVCADVQKNAVLAVLEESPLFDASSEALGAVFRLDRLRAVTAS